MDEDTWRKSMPTASVTSTNRTASAAGRGAVRGGQEPQRRPEEDETEPHRG